MRDQPKITVLTATYNRPEFLPEAIAGVINQTRLDWEMLVINDGGRDVGDIISSFGDPRIKYHSRPSNMGKAACCNLGLSLARGDLIAYLDDDDLWRPRHLEILSRALEENPNIIGAFSDLYLVPYILDPATGRRHPVEKIMTLSRDFNRELMFHTNHVHHVSLMHRREAAVRAGLYNESVSVLIDWNINRKLAFIGDMLHVPVPTGEYYVSMAGEGRISSAKEKNKKKYRDSVRLIKADNPPLPWPHVKRLDIIAPCGGPPSQAVSLIEPLIDDLDHPAGIIIVDNFPQAPGQAGLEIRDLMRPYANTSVVTPPERPLPLFEAYALGGRESGADFFFLAGQDFQPGAAVKRFSSGLEFLNSSAALGVRWDIPQEQAGPFNCLVRKEFFSLKNPLKLLGDPRAVPVLPKIGRPPRHLEFDVALAVVRHRLDRGEIESARMEFDRILEIERGGGLLPAIMDLHLELSIKTGDLARLETDLRKSIAAGYEPDNLIRLGRVLAFQKRLEPAADAFQAGLEASGFKKEYLEAEVFPYPFDYEPLVLTALLGLGDCYSGLGDLAGAEAWYSRAAGFSSTCTRALLDLGRTCLAAARRDQGFERLGQALEQGAGDESVLELFLRSGRALGRRDDIIRVLTAYTAHHPEMAFARRALAEIKAAPPPAGKRA